LPTVERGRIDRSGSSMKMSERRALTIYQAQIEGKVKTQK